MSIELPQPQHTELTDEAIKFDVIQGDGPHVWTRKPAEFDISAPITGRIFATSNVLRNIKPAPYKINVAASGRRAVYEDRPSTPYAAVIKDIYKHTLPLTQRELADILGNEAAEHEYEYLQEDYEHDLNFQAGLREVVAAHAGSLLMQGFKAYKEAADDYDGLINETYINRARMFGGYLIHTLY